MTERPDRNLAMELVRVTEAAALAAGRWIGHGDKNAADQAAVDAMRLMIDTVSMDGVVVIGEGEKDEAPMLFNGERVGDGDGPGTDVAVDPIDGTRLTAVGQPNALAVIALAPRGTMFFPGAALYMEKIATGPDAAEVIDIDAPVAENIRQVAKAKGKRPEEVTVTILDRDRHAGLIAEIREVGARVFLITDGDVAGAIVAAAPRTEVDLLIGIGGTPEGVIAAAALRVPRAARCKGTPVSAQRRGAPGAARRGATTSIGCPHRGPVAGDDVFFAATGITDGYLLRGVRYWPDGASDALDGDALALRHGPLRRVRAFLREARAVLADPVPTVTPFRSHHASAYTPVSVLTTRPSATRARSARRTAPRTSGSTNGSRYPARSARSWITVQCIGSSASPSTARTASRGRAHRHAGITSSANTSTISGSITANGSAHGERISSSTPSASKARTRSTTCSGDPLSVSARHVSQVSSRIARPGNDARARSKRARASSSVSPTIPYSPTVLRNVAGSRPSRPHAAATSATRRACSSGDVRHTTFQPAA